MAEINQENSSNSEQRADALSSWDNEGGAGPRISQEGIGSKKEQSDLPPLTELEIMHFRVRVIALENLVVAVLAHSSAQVLTTGREMTNYISPRPGATHHRLTTDAAAHMLDLIERSENLQVE